MKVILFALLTSLLTSCQSMQSNDPSSLNFDIPDGSTLTLNKDLAVAEGNTHTLIQHGKIVTEKSKDLYSLSCRFEMKAFGPRTVKPDSFNVTRTEDGSELAQGRTIVSNYTEVYIYSAHNSDIIKLLCSVWADRMDRHFVVSEMQKTLGDYFSFTFVKGTIRQPKTR